MKGILLAGGKGSRLFPSTLAVSKQLLPIYDKPMIYYSLSVLMLAGIQDILLITKPEDTSQFHKLLGDGSEFGISIHYAVQTEPGGIPEALKIGKHFLGGDDVFLVLGDNLVFGTGLSKILLDAKQNNRGGSIFTYPVKQPSRYGVLELGRNGEPKKIVEKPEKPKSKLAVTGLYMFDGDAAEKASSLKKSKRGETEIVDLISIYLNENKLDHYSFGRGYAWFDTGTHGSMLEASQFVETIEKRQGWKIACLEEIALINNWMSREELVQKSKLYSNNCYGEYLKNIAENAED